MLWKTESAAFWTTRLSELRGQSEPDWLGYSLFSLLLTTVATAGRVVIRDANGNVVAEVAVPEGGTVNIDDTGS